MGKLLYALLILIITIVTVPFNVLAETSRDVKIGDVLILDGGYLAVCVSFDNDGRPQYQTDLSTPKYLPDKKTLINTEWKDVNGTYVNGDNLFDSYVSGDAVTVNDISKSMSWCPTVEVKGIKYKNSNKAKLLESDPLNPNYKKNTLEWDLGNGILRRLRIIEGAQLEYYVITKPLNEDIVIKGNVTAGATLTSNKPVAWDADGNNVEITADNHIITLKKGENVKYPITIDPDVTFTTSASDGMNGNLDVVYADARGEASSSSSGSTSSNINVENSAIGAPAPYVVTRAYVYFNTAALSGYVVTAANLRLYIFSVINDADGDAVRIQSGMPDYPHDPLVASDFDLTQYANDGGQKTFATMVLNAYNTITLTPAGLAMINTTGWTKLCLRTVNDITNGTPSGYNGIYIKSYEAGAGYRPQLVVTFTATAPGIITVAASDITTETVRLNSQITDDGSGAMGVENCTARFGYCTTATLVDGTGTATGSPISLLPDDVVNNVDVTGLGNFTVTLPTGYTGTATSDVATVAGSPQALVAGANVVTVGGVVGNIKVQVVLSNFDTLVNITVWDDNGGSYYHTGAVPYYDALGLTPDTQYYFCVQVKNTHSTVTATVERYFSTLISVGDMTQFVGYPDITSIKLNWLKSSGANRTMVRFRTDTYPTGVADGTLLYLGTLTSYEHTGLGSGTTYYYSAWGETSGTYSTNEINLVMTTEGGISTESIPSPSDPAGGWFVNPDETFLVNLQPWYSVINGVADSWGMPRENAWFGMILLVILILGIGTYIAFHAPAFSMLLMALGMMAGVALHLLSPYMLVFIFMLGLGAWATRPAGGV